MTKLHDIYFGDKLITLVLGQWQWLKNSNKHGNPSIQWKKQEKQSNTWVFLHHSIVAVARGQQSLQTPSGQNRDNVAAALSHVLFFQARRKLAVRTQNQQLRTHPVSLTQSRTTFHVLVDWSLWRRNNQWVVMTLHFNFHLFQTLLAYTPWPINEHDFHIWEYTCFHGNSYAVPMIDMSWPEVSQHFSPWLRSCSVLMGFKTWIRSPPFFSWDARTKWPEQNKGRSSSSIRSQHLVCECDPSSHYTFYCCCCCCFCGGGGGGLVIFLGSSM